MGSDKAETAVKATSKEVKEDNKMQVDSSEAAVTDSKPKDKQHSDDKVVPQKRSADESKADESSAVETASNGDSKANGKTTPKKDLKTNGKHAVDEASDTKDEQPSKKQKTESDFTNSTEDDKRTGGDQPATNKQKAFVEVLANQSNKEISKEKLEDMSRNEASEKIDALKSEADKNQPTALEVDKTPEAGTHLAQPDKWATGEEPATDKQGKYLAVLEKKAGESVDAGKGLTKSEASEKIQELKEKTGS